MRFNFDSFDSVFFIFGFNREKFSARTGLDASVIEDTVQRFLREGLLEIDGPQIKTSELGRRFLDTVVAGFFPDP